MRKRTLLFDLLAGVCGVASGLLLVRLIVRLLLGNPANPVVRLVLAFTRPLLFPWSGLWPPSELPVVELERAALLSLVMYFLAGILLGLAGRLTNRHQAKEE